MKANQAAHSVTTMCRVLGVSASGYYAWQQRDLSPRTRQDQQLLEQIRASHHRSLYLAVVLDVWSRRIVGWAMATHLRTGLVVAALDMAIAQRQPAAVIHHSDQGCQYTALEFGRRCREANVRPSMGSVGDCYDNALCESFFATLECELLERVTLRTPAEARTTVFDFIEGWYNPTRRHSALDYLSPNDFERQAVRGPAGEPRGTEAAA